MNRELYWRKNEIDGDWELYEVNQEHKWPMRAYIRRNKEEVSIRVRVLPKGGPVWETAWDIVARLPPKTSTLAARKMAMNYCLLSFDTGA
jgi:beta-galactosidase/beta-glucuronidase